MAVDRSSSPGCRPLRRLSKQELDRYVERVVAEVTEAGEPQSAEQQQAHPLRPRLISPAELVRRMRRFLVYN